jgi:hypothetical protein
MTLVNKELNWIELSSIIPSNCGQFYNMFCQNQMGNGAWEGSLGPFKLEELEYTKGVIRIRKSKKDRKRND